MAGRRDQYQGYRFVIRRQAGALLRPEQDSADSPLRRLSVGALGSVVAGVLGLTAAGLFGVFSPAPSAAGWENGKTLIVDAQTGSRYVYLDNALHPVLNYASALLILKSGAVTATQVPDSQLSRVQHGAPVGIPGAPDAVPGPSGLLSGTWSACSVPAQTPAGDPWALVDVALGPAPAGTALGTATGAGGTAQNGAVLVEDPAGEQYLIWDGTRLAVPGGSSYVLTVLGAAATAPVTVGDAWLDTLRQGPDLAAPAVAGPVVRVGDSGGYYARLADGLAPLTALQAQLLMAQEGQNAPTPVSAAEAASSAASAADPAKQTGLPATVPTLVSAPQGALEVCAQFGGHEGGQVTVTTRAQDPQLLGTAPTTPVDALGAPLADSVSVVAGHGALIEALPNPGVTTGTEYLVTDLGVKYPVATSSVLSDLGLSGATATQVPESLAAIIPEGPSLSEVAAPVTQPVGPSAAATATSASSASAGA